ncbi:MAG: Ig-like domain-containing protein [Patescibacteria group bacterium]
MKNFLKNKISLFIIALLVIGMGMMMVVPSAKAAISAVSVTTPNGGENWNGSKNITWATTPEADPATVNIYYCVGANCDSNSYTLIVAGTANDGSEAWDTATAGGDAATYKIKVTSNADTLIGDTSNAVFTVDNTKPTISNISIPNTAMNVGDVVTATITTGSDSDAYTLTSGTVGGFALGSLAKTSATSYTAIFTVTDNGTDVAAGSDVPVANLVLTDTATNASLTYSTPISQAGDSIDANLPNITGVSIPNVAMKVGNVVTATITIDDDGVATGTTLTGGTIGGFTLDPASVIIVGNTSITATFTIANGGTDVAVGAVVPVVGLTLLDALGNPSNTYTADITQNADAIDANRPIISGVAITAGAYKIGDAIPVTITADAAGYTAGAITINGQPLGAFADATGGVYTGTYTVVSLDTDRASVGAIPVSVILIDAATNSSIAYISAPTSSGTVTVDANAPIVSAIAISPSSGYANVGDVITVTVTADAPLYVQSAVTVNTKAVGSFTDVGDNTYTFTYTVAENDTDRASNALPASVVFADTAGNTNVAYTTVTANTLVVDAHSPDITNVSIPNSAMNVGDTVTATITIADDGDATGTTLTGGTIGGFTLNPASVIIVGNTTITATFTVTDNGTDIATGAVVPVVGLTLLDAAGNPSNTYTADITQNADAIDANNPDIVSVSIPDVTMNVGDTVTATITTGTDADTFTLVSGAIGGFNLGALTKTGDTTYTATFTITDNGTDVAASASIPVTNLVLTDTALNVNTAYSTPIAQASDLIDANLPNITGVSIPNVAMNVGDVVTATITIDDDGVATGTTLTGGTIGGFALGSLAVTSNTTLTATFTVTNSGTDVIAGAVIPIVGLIVTDAAGNPSNTYVTPITQDSDAVDANIPTYTVAGVSIDKGGDTVALTFSEAMIPATLDVDSLTGITSITGSTGGALTLTNATGVWSAGDTVYTITLNEAIDTSYIVNGVTETVVLAATVTDLAGNPVSTSGVASAAVAKEAVTPTITIAAASVNGGGDTVTITSDEVLADTALTNSNWTVQYADNNSGLNIQTLSLANATIIFTDATKTIVRITLDEVTDGSSIPSSKWVKVTPNTTNIKDLVGNNAVAAVYTAAGISSESTAPTITAVSVADAATGVAINSTITITMSEALDQLTVNNNTIKLYNDLGTADAVNIGTDTEVAATISLENNGASTKIYINPTSDLSNSGNYIYRISTGVKDLSGNALAANADYDFTTVAAGAGTFGIVSTTNITNQTTGGAADNTYTNGWEWKIRITLPTNQNDFALKFNNWTSGSNSLTAAGNMKYYSEQIGSGTGSSAETAVPFATANTFPANLTVSTDADATLDGIQTDVHVMVKIPSSTASGSYSTSYWVNYE